MSCGTITMEIANGSFWALTKMACSAPICVWAKHGYSTHALHDAGGGCGRTHLLFGEALASFLRCWPWY